MTLGDLPHLNAVLNAACTTLLLLGYRAIRQSRRSVHRKLMMAAFATSVVFITSYLVYHFNYGVLRFGEQGLVRIVYFAILTSHTILAVAVAPLVIYVLSMALRERFDRHKRLAVWVFPAWVYVNVTGIIVYFMLYHLYPVR